MKSMIRNFVTLGVLLLLVAETSSSPNGGSIGPIIHHCRAQEDLASSLRAKLNQVELDLGDLATTAEAQLQGRFTSINECRTGGSRGCSVPSCSENFDTIHGFQCLSSGYGNATGVCGGTTCGNGLVRSLTESVVSVPPDSSFTSASAEAFLCATKPLDTTFAQKADSGNLTGFQYVAERFGGAVRVFPGFPQERGAGFCGNYDVRLRSWFVTAMSGKKEVVIVYDKSGSMSASAGFEGLTRMAAVKNSVVRLLQTLTLDDRVGLVRFSSSATSHTGSSLVQAAPKTIEKLIEEVREVSAGGGTSFGTGIETAFDLLADSDSPCTPLILFLTDGEATDGEAVFDAIERGQAKLTDSGKSRAFIHTYSMGSGADDQKPKKMACGNEGIWYPISSGEDPLKQMSQYYKFLADSAVSTKIRWSAPYEDALGAGLTITGARSLVDRSDINAPIVLGVVATDVVLGTEFGLNETNAVLEEELSGRGECIVKTVTFCSLQKLRAEVSNGFTCPLSDAKTGDDTNCDDINLESTVTVSLPNINNLLCEELNTTSRVPTTPRRAYPYSTRDVSCCSTTAVGGILTGVATPTPTTSAPVVTTTTTLAPTTTTSAPTTTPASSTPGDSSSGTDTSSSSASGSVASAAGSTAEQSSSSNSNLGLDSSSTTAVADSTTTTSGGGEESSSSSPTADSSSGSFTPSSPATPVPTATNTDNNELTGCAFSATVSTASSLNVNYWDYQTVSLCASAKACASTLCSCNGGTPNFEALALQSNLAVTMSSWCSVNASSSSSSSNCATIEKCLWEFNKCVSLEVATATSASNAATVSTACAAWGTQLKPSFTALKSSAGEAIFSSSQLVQDCERFACQTTSLFGSDSCASNVTTCNVGCTRLQLPDPKPGIDDGSDGTVLGGDSQIRSGSGVSSYSILSIVLVIFLVGLHALMASTSNE